MRISEIAPGQKRGINIIDFDRLWERSIKTNCSEIIEIYRDAGRLLYRGTKNNPPIYRGRSLDDRQPTDSSKKLSDLFNQMLAANGMTALRSNSIFVSSGIALARKFGVVYVVFPLNGFEFTYTNQIDIILDNMDDFIDGQVDLELNQKFAKAWESQGKDAWSVNWIKTDNIQPNPLNQLPAAIKRLKAMLPDDREVQALTIEKLINPETFARRYQPRNTDLGHAIKNVLEVYIRGQYYAIEFLPHKDQIHQKIFGKS